MKIYLAGPLFTAAEMSQRRMEAVRLRELGYEVYSPIEANDDIGYDPDRLYQLDIEAMEAADIAVVSLDNLDSGTVAELGWFVGKGKPAFSTNTNWKHKETRNLFVRGLALQGPNKMFHTLEDMFQFMEGYIRG